MTHWEVHSPTMISKQCWNYLDAKEEETVFKRLIRSSKLPIRAKALGDRITLLVEELDGN